MEQQGTVDMMERICSLPRISRSVVRVVSTVRPRVLKSWHFGLVHRVESVKDTLKTELQNEFNFYQQSVEPNES